MLPFHYTVSASLLTLTKRQHPSTSLLPPAKRTYITRTHIHMQAPLFCKTAALVNRLLHKVTYFRQISMLLSNSVNIYNQTLLNAWFLGVIHPIRADCPPSTGRSTPVMNRDSSDARKSAAFATSQPLPIFPPNGTAWLRRSMTSCRS